MYQISKWWKFSKSSNICQPQSFSLFGKFGPSFYLSLFLFSLFMSSFVSHFTFFFFSFFINIVFFLYFIYSFLHCFFFISFFILFKICLLNQILSSIIWTIDGYSFSSYFLIATTGSNYEIYSQGFAGIPFLQVNVPPLSKISDATFWLTRYWAIVYGLTSFKNRDWSCLYPKLCHHTATPLKKIS